MAVNRITITLERHTLDALKLEAVRRQMEIPDLCEDLIDVALVHLGKYDQTPAAEFANFQRSYQDE